MSACPRPILRYFGGKWRLAPWIIAHFPPHAVYVEPFGGAASVLLRKPRAEQEVYNDLDAELVTLFRVLRSDRARELIDAVALTPFAREEFEAAYVPTDDPVERARRLIVCAFFGHGGKAVQYQSTGFRAVTRTSNSPVVPWTSYPEALRAIVERLRGVCIENRPALEVLRAHDRPEALHYVDPPYPFTTRSPKRHGGGPHHGYAHEMDDAAHAGLLEVLTGLRGRVILSGYPCPLYDDALSGWHRRDIVARDTANQSRTEVIWMNFDPAAAPPPGGLFANQEEPA